MKVSGICHYNLRASRETLESLRIFYCDIVGLSVGPRPDFRSFGYWLYAGTKDVLHLSESRPGEERPVGAVSTLDHVAFSCSGLAAYKERLDASNIPYRSSTPPGTNQVQLFFKDPAGNGIELNFSGSET